MALRSQSPPRTSCRWSDDFALRMMSLLSAFAGKGMRVADIVLINPRFEVSYWGMEHALSFLGKKANLPVACLPLLAALTPAPYQVTLVDENVEELDFDRLAKAD